MPVVKYFLLLDWAVCRICSFCAQLLLALAATLGFYQVLTRFLFQMPSEWTEVLTRTAVVWMVYIGLCVAFREGAMVSVALLHNRLVGRARRMLSGIIAAACTGFLATVAWYGAQVAYAVRFQTLAGLDISISWAYLAIPVGATLAIVGVIAHFLDPAHQELDHAV